MDAHLAQLVRQNTITVDLAMSRAAVPEELRRLLGTGAMNQATPQQAYAGAATTLGSTL